MKPRPLLLLLALAWIALAATTTSLRAVEGRFSQALAISERAEIGFNRLSSDQVAALDALVRRDLATKSSSSTPRAGEPPVPARFSQRLTAEERIVAGLATFNEQELARLDAIIEQHGNMMVARELLAPPVFYPTGMRLRPIPDNPKTAPEIHGSMFLSYSFGSGGYSEKTGGITLNYNDPVHNLAISVSYAESHVKGPAPYLYRDGYLPDQTYGPPYLP